MTTLFVVILTYVAPIEEIDAAGADHVAWLRRGYEEGIFLTSGRRIPRTGGIIIAKGASVDAIADRLRDDPFQKLGLATAEVIPFEPNMSADAMKAIL